VKNTYGTGCFILANVGDTPVQSSAGLLTTMCYKIGDSPTQYALEGSVELAGASVEWAKSVGFVDKVSEMESQALSVPDCGGVYFVPAL
jgi:glycerol kinase